MVMQKSWRTPLGRGLLGLVVGGLCLWLSLRGLDLEELRTALSQSQVSWLAAALAAVVVVAFIKAARWWFLYPRSFRPSSWLSTFPVLMTAQMLNVLVPLRLGEIARVGLMLQEHVSAGSTLSTIVVEKSLDLLAVGCLIILILPAAVLPDWFPLSSGMSMGFSGVALLAALLAIWLGRARLKALAGRILGFRGWLPARWQARLMRLVSEILDGLGALTDLKSALPVVALTVGNWLASIFTMAAMLAAFGLPVQWHVALVLSLTIYLSNLVPTPPALVGVIGAVTVMTLRWFEIVRVEATALGLALNVVLISPLVILGGWSTWQRFSKLTQGDFKERWVWSLGLKKHP